MHVRHAKTGFEGSPDLLCGEVRLEFLRASVFPGSEPSPVELAAAHTVEGVGSGLWFCLYLLCFHFFGIRVVEQDPLPCASVVRFENMRNLADEGKSRADDLL